MSAPPKPIAWWVPEGITDEAIAAIDDLAAEAGAARDRARTAAAEEEAAQSRLLEAQEAFEEAERRLYSAISNATEEADPR